MVNRDGEGLKQSNYFLDEKVKRLKFIIEMARGLVPIEKNKLRAMIELHFGVSSQTAADYVRVLRETEHLVMDGNGMVKRVKK